MDQWLIAVLGASGLLAQSDVGQFDPTLKPDAHLIAGSPVVGRGGPETGFATIVRVASPAFDERFVVRTVHPTMMTVQPLGFDTVQSVNIFGLNPSAPLRGKTQDNLRGKTQDNALASKPGRRDCR